MWGFKVFSVFSASEFTLLCKGTNVKKLSQGSTLISFDFISKNFLPKTELPNLECSLFVIAVNQLVFTVVNYGVIS